MNSTSSASSVTYYTAFRQSLRVLYKFCVTNKGRPTVAKLQEAGEL